MLDAPSESDVMNRFILRSAALGLAASVLVIAPMAMGHPPSPTHIHVADGAPGRPSSAARSSPDATDAPSIRSVHEAGAMAAEVFNRIEGTAYEARVEGARNARRAASRPLRALSLDAAPGFPLHDNADVEHEFEAQLRFELGPRARRARQAWTAQGSAFVQQADAARWLYVTEAERLYAQWWAKEAIANHLAEDLEEVRTEVDRWTRDLAAYFSTLDLLDADAETMTLSMEAANAALEANAAAAAFHAHIGVPVALALGEEPALSIERAGAENPWTPLQAHVQALPQLAALEAEANAHEQRARALQSRDFELGVGARARLDPDANTLLSPVVSLVIPLARATGDEAAVARAESVALQAEARRRAKTLLAWLEGEATQHDALVRALAAIDDDAVQRLSHRVDQLALALAAGHVDLRRVFLARRDLHEALHQALLLRAELAASEAAAAGVHALIESAQ